MAEKPLYGQLLHADSIRLFYLHPTDTHDAALAGSLVVVRRSQCPQYRALSYMWGPPDPSTEQKLLVNNHVLPLRANLASSLRAYREHHHARRIKENLPLWIDLICIQQDCVQEKNHQVQQMGAIYEQALSVLIWLGERTKVDILGCFHGNTTTKNLLAKRPSNVAELRLLFRRLLNQHWTRVWILQELCLAQNIALLTEDLVFNSSVLTQFQTERFWIDEAYPSGWIASAQYPNPHATAIDLVDRFCKIWTVRDSRRDARWKPLSLCSTIFQLGRDSDCSHHRDKVFGFLQMSAMNAELTVDYERDETLIFWDVLTLTTMQELGFPEIDCLREVLQLTWLRVLRSTSYELSTFPQERLLPCYIDCGTLTIKANRARPPLRKCRKSTERFDCWFQTNSTSAETMFQIVVTALNDRLYEVIDLRFCPNQDDVTLYGNLVAKSPSLLQVLDESWASRWETAAVSPDLFVTLCFLASLDPSNFEDMAHAAFPDAAKTQDQYFKQRRAAKLFGMRLA